MELWKIRNGESTAKPGEELRKEETHYCNDSPATFNDQRLYKGEKAQQGHDAIESISDESKVQIDWPRKHLQMDEKEPYKSAMMCWESLDDSEQANKKRERHMVKTQEQTMTRKNKPMKWMTKHTPNLQQIWRIN